MTVEVKVFVDNDADPAARIVAFAKLAGWVNNGFELPDDEVDALGRFVWACGNLDTWLAVSGLTIIGALAQRGNEGAENWLITLRDRGIGSIRVIAQQYLTSLGVTHGGLD